MEDKVENVKTKDLTFGQAVDLINKGELVCREGWNGKKMFIFKRPHDNIDISVVPNIKSLPQKVKDYFINEFAGGKTHFDSGNPIQIHFGEYLCMKDAQGNIVNGWLASQTDILADDWQVFEA